MEAMPSSMELGNFDARARASPLKLASLPPLVKVPLNSPGQPTRSPIQRTVSCSIFEANCERFTVASWRGVHQPEIIGARNVKTCLDHLSKDFIQYFVRILSVLG